jgi:hypothetical protein
LVWQDLTCLAVQVHMHIARKRKKKVITHHSKGQKKYNVDKKEAIQERSSKCQYILTFLVY